MKSGQRSRTAEAAAAFRSHHFLYEHPIVFRDPYGLDLTSASWRMVCKNRILNWLVFKRLLGFMKPLRAQILARSRYAEDKLESSMNLGIAQYVILGAGFDSFALRRRELVESLRVYEVDHILTQKVKRQRLDQILGGELPKNLEFIDIDFENEKIPDAFTRSTYSKEETALFGWVGTTHYLTREAVLETLGTINSFAAPCSELVFDYGIPAELLSRERQQDLEKLHRFAARRGEPILTTFHPDEIEREIEAIGMETLENCSPDEQTSRYFSDRTDGLAPLGSYFAHVRVR